MTPCDTELTFGALSDAGIAMGQCVGTGLGARHLADDHIT